MAVGRAGVLHGNRKFWQNIAGRMKTMQFLPATQQRRRMIVTITSVSVRFRILFLNGSVGYGHALTGTSEIDKKNVIVMCFDEILKAFYLVNIDLKYLATMVSKSGHDMCARDLSTPSEPEVLLGLMRNSGDKDEVFEIPEETDWSDWSELELEDSQMDIECRCSIRLELESC